MVSFPAGLSLDDSGWGRGPWNWLYPRAQGPAGISTGSAHRWVWGTDPHRHTVQECYTQARPKPQTIEVEAVAKPPGDTHPHGEPSAGGGSRCQYSFDAQALAAQPRSLAPNGWHSLGEHFAWETTAACGVTGVGWGGVVLRPLRPTHRPLAGGAPPPPAPALRQSLCWFPEQDRCLMLVTEQVPGHSFLPHVWGQAPDSGLGFVFLQ